MKRDNVSLFWLMSRQDLIITSSVTAWPQYIHSCPSMTSLQPPLSSGMTSLQPLCPVWPHYNLPLSRHDLITTLTVPVWLHYNVPSPGMTPLQPSQSRCELITTSPVSARGCYYFSVSSMKWFGSLKIVLFTATYPPPSSLYFCLIPISQFT